MMWNYGSAFGGNNLYPGVFWGNLMAGLSFLILPLVIWSLFWKGWALWVAARNGSKGWFIVLLVLNTVGILDIVYIFLIAKQGGKTLRRK